MYNKKIPLLKEWCKDNILTPSQFHGSVGHGCTYLRLFISVTILAILFILISAQPIAAMTSYEHQRGVEIAKSHKILFDGDFEVLDSIHLLNGEEYYIIKQKNFFLFANRLDIYRSDGHVVENHKISKSIFEV